MSDPILEADGLSKSFEGVTANDGLTLSVDRGECHGIIGPNGSGKTTFFDLVTGVTDPDSGTVRFDGADVTGASPDSLARRGLVRTFQVASPFGGLTVRENLLATYTPGLSSGGRVSEGRRERAAEVLSRLGLRTVADHAASDVSGGQQKLLELGRVLLLDPTCVLLDEPTAGVNPAIQKQVLAVLRELHADGVTVVVIEHDMSVVEDLADRVTVLDEGRVLTQGEFAEVTGDDRVQDAYFGPGTEARGDSTATLSTERDSTATTATGDDSTATSAAGSDSTTAASATGSDPSGDAIPPEQAIDLDAGEAVGSTFAGERDADEARLVARDVVAGYGTQVVVDGVSIGSRDGVTCIFGPNGSGKSTLLKALAGVVPVRAGTVEYGGRPITDLAPHEVVQRGVTTVPQRERVFRGLSVRENLQLGATTVTDDAVAEARLAEVLDLFPPLAASLSEPAGSLSGGQQVMLAVARGMMTGADVYLLDEPLAGLAPALVEDVLEIVETLADAGAQVVMVEQQVRAAIQVADYVYVLSQGESQFEGQPADLRDEDELLDLYLGIA
jgi:ABC-type branched-subunit amino acid transport system ATPase component